MSDRAETLCHRAKTGDISAASELVGLFYEQIFAYFRRLCGNDDDAADLTQKTFFKVWTSLATYQQRSSFSTWLHGIAHHVYVDWRRANKPVDSQPDEWWETRPAEGPSPFEDVAERDLAHRLFALVDRLEDRAKEAVHLHYYQGLSLQETAEALGIATSTVKYRLREALDFLRAQTKEPTLRPA
jgi:RNA polymerase sigma-70 factor (ECF subfamily)